MEGTRKTEKYSLPDILLPMVQTQAVQARVEGGWGDSYSLVVSGS